MKSMGVSVTSSTLVQLFYKINKEKKSSRKLNTQILCDLQTTLYIISLFIVVVGRCDNRIIVKVNIFTLIIFNWQTL